MKMKKRKLISSISIVSHTGYRLLAACMIMLFAICASRVSTWADDDVKPNEIYAVGKKNVTVTAGNEVELRIRTEPADADDDYLKWTIVSGSEYIAFDSDDNDDEIELKALRPGTAKIRCTIQGTQKSVNFTVKVKKAQAKIKAAMSKNKTVEAGDDFELKIKKYPGLKNRYLKWQIGNSDILRFEGSRKTGDEVEFVAVRSGKTTVTCQNTKTGQKVRFVITVTEDLDDDWDDDDDDD